MNQNFTKTIAATSELLANEDGDAFTNSIIGSGICHQASVTGRYQIEKLLSHPKVQCVFSEYSTSKTAQRAQELSQKSKDELDDKEAQFLEVYHHPSSDKPMGYFNVTGADGEVIETQIVEVFVLYFEDEEAKATVKFDLQGSYSYKASFVANQANYLAEVMNFITEGFYLGSSVEATRERPMINIVNKGRNGTLALHEIPLRENRVMEKDRLTAHYGESILNLQKELKTSLKEDQCGLHLFQGAPGMGKTSYINHLCGELAGVHTLVYVPNASFEELVDPQNMHFWLNIAEDMEDGQKILLVVEDAESLLLNRESYDSNRSAVSSLLNLCDGLMGQVLGLHLLATANTDLDNIDSAILRAGRLKTHHVFNKLDTNEAQRLANYLQKDLPLEEGKEYTISEIYHGESVHDSPQETSKIGFHALV